MSRMIDEALKTKRDLEKVGVISKQTKRNFEAQALRPPTYMAEAIRRLRELTHQPGGFCGLPQRQRLDIAEMGNR